MEDKIADLAGPVLDALGFALVRVRIAGGTLQIMAEPADEAREMTVDDCADISRGLSKILDEEDPIKTAYALEVSSPGLARPLMKPEDYARFSGMAAKIATREVIDGRRRFKGRLGGLTEAGAVLMETEDGMQVIPFERIEKARLDPSALFAKGAKRGHKDMNTDNGMTKEG